MHAIHRSAVIGLALLVALSLPTAAHAIGAAKVGDSVIDGKALTFLGGRWAEGPNGRSHQQDGITSHAGYQYATYFNSDRLLEVARRKLPNGEWERAVLPNHKYDGTNSHKTTQMGISHKDGRIHLMFDMHASRLNYRVSEPGVASNPGAHKWSAALFGGTKHGLRKGRTTDKFTYPRFFNHPDGTLQIWYRRGGSGNGDGMMTTWNEGASSWTTPVEVIKKEGKFPGGSSTRSPYTNGQFYDSGGTLHVTWTFRETGDGKSNHDLYYAYSEDRGRTWKNNAGRTVATAGSNPIHIGTPGIRVVEIPLGRENANGMTMYVDDQRRVHTVQRHNSIKGVPGGMGYYHHWRDANGTWHSRAMGFDGGRGKIVADRNGDAMFVYKGGFIATATARSAYSDWRMVLKPDRNYLTEPIYDLPRWRAENVLSVYIQERAGFPGLPSALRVVDFKLVSGGAPQANEPAAVPPQQQQQTQQAATGGGRPPPPGCPPPPR